MHSVSFGNNMPSGMLRSVPRPLPPQVSLFLKKNFRSKWIEPMDFTLSSHATLLLS